MVVQLMYRPLRHFKVTLGSTLWSVCTRNTCYYDSHHVTVKQGMIGNGTVNVYAHAVILEIQYFALL